MPPRSMLLATALLAASGCSDPVPATGSSRLEVSVDTTGPFPVVRNVGQPPRWSVEPYGTVGSVGSAFAPAPDEFGRVTSVTPGPDSTVWVADRYGGVIKVFGPDGHVRLEIGGEGQGPGEFTGLYSLAWVGEGLLLALDLGNGRVAELSADGTWLGTRPAPGRVSGSGSQLRFFPASDTSVIQWSITSVNGELARSWVLQGPSGALDTWPQSDERVAPNAIVCNREAAGTITLFMVPFSGEVLQHPLPNRARYRMWSAEYRLALIGAEGDTVRVVERDWPPLAITDQMWEDATASFRDFRSEAPDAECTPRSMDRPAERAPIENLLMDDRGRVWIEAERGDGTVWEVFDSDGRLVGSLPGFDYDDSVAPTIHRGSLAWARTDSLGVQYVEWGRLIEAEAP